MKGHALFYGRFSNVVKTYQLTTLKNLLQNRSISIKLWHKALVCEKSDDCSDEGQIHVFVFVLSVSLSFLLTDFKNVRTTVKISTKLT